MMEGELRLVQTFLGEARVLSHVKFMQNSGKEARKRRGSATRGQIVFCSRGCEDVRDLGMDLLLRTSAVVLPYIGFRVVRLTQDSGTALQ